MSQDKLNKSIVILFLLVLFSIPAFWTFVDKNQPIKSIEEGRDLQPFPALGVPELKSAIEELVVNRSGAALNEYGKRFSTREFQVNYEASLSDRFLFRIELIRTANWVERRMIEVAYLFTDDPVIPASAKNKILITRDHSQLMRSLEIFGQKDKVGIEQGVETYQKLLDQFSEQNFYAFYIQRIQESKHHPLARFYQNADLGRSIEYFEEIKPERLNLEKLVFTDYNDINLFYLTDPHWNARGVCRAYDLIYPMLAKNYPEISPKLDCAQYIIIPGVKFLGTFARETLYPVDPEIFEVSTVSLPDHIMLIDGKVAKKNALKRYMAGDFNTGKYTNHFQELYGRNEQEPEFYFPGNPPRNLLIIGSSYRKPIAFLLASHYSHTYSLDLRVHTKLKLSNFLATHPVDDILIIGEPTVVFLNGAWEIKP